MFSKQCQESKKNCSGQLKENGGYICCVRSIFISIDAAVYDLAAKINQKWPLLGYACDKWEHDDLTQEFIYKILACTTSAISTRPPGQGKTNLLKPEKGRYHPDR